MYILSQIMERNKGLELSIHHAARIGHQEMVQLLLVSAPGDTIGRSINKTGTKVVHKNIGQGLL